jgi:DnaJ-domain-containing protein 1
MTKILLSLTGDQVSVKLKSSDRDAFSFLIEALKDAIPAYDRTYSPASKEWFIHASARADLEMWLDDARAVFNAKVEWQPSKGKERPRTRTTPRNETTAHAVLHLLPSAPPEVVRAAYKALAMKHHPDHGGDTEAMQKINEAYRRLAA